MRPESPKSRRDRLVVCPNSLQCHSALVQIDADERNTPGPIHSQGRTLRVSGRKPLRDVKEVTFSFRSLHGFTLVEVLVVVAIIGTIVGLLMPAIQSAREAARRVTCQNNLKQTTLAVLAYETSRKRFPVAVTGRANDPNPCDSNVADKRQNWIVRVLPFLEETSVYNRFDLSKSPTDESNRPARASRITTLLCPTDSNNRQRFMGSSGGESTMYGDDWERGNYGANSSLRFLGNDCCDGEATGSSAAGWADRFRRGVMGFNTAVTAAEITDGLSKTALLLELRAGLTSYDGRGVWALGMPGASSLWAHGGIFHDANGPNGMFYAADDIPNCFQLRNQFGTYQLGEMSMGCYPGGTTYWQGATARSMHVGGIFISFADGSVRWINDFIDVMPSTQNALSVWDKLMLSADGQHVSSDGF